MKNNIVKLFKNKKHRTRIFSLTICFLILSFCLGTYINTFSEFVVPSTTHATGIEGTSVYLNDLEADWYYYMGLNYTKSTDGTLPTTINKNLYKSTNLVAAYITYTGLDLAGDNHGYVSITENYDTFVYYKYYPVNTNNTTTTSDDYIEIELIDNPWSKRPNDKAFNGWVTSYSDNNRYPKITYDSDTYTRYAKVPVSYNGTTPSTIEITFNTSWVSSTMSTVGSNSWSNAFSILKSAGMSKLITTVDVYDDPLVEGYYLSDTITTTSVVTNNSWRPGSNNYTVNTTYGTCTNCYDGDNTYYENVQYSCSAPSTNNIRPRPGNSQTVTNTCTVYYLQDENAVYDEDEYYYEWNDTYEYYYYVSLSSTYAGTEQSPDFPSGTIMAGYYRKITINNGGYYTGYYDSNGVLQTSTNACTNGGGCTYYELIPYYNSSGNAETVNTTDEYYYLVTRDTNFVVMTSSMSSAWSSSQNKPFTLTSVYNGTDYRNSVTWTIYWDDESYYYSSGISANCYNDTRIEYIKMSAGTGTSIQEPTADNEYGGFLYGNWHNLKLGRGIIKSGNYVNLVSIVAGSDSDTGSSANATKYKIIVESGYYNSISESAGAATGTNYNTSYIDGVGIFGSDYDRAVNNNDGLDVYYCLSGTWSRNYSSTNTTSGVMLTTYVKSGEFGSSHYDLSTGIYVGGRYGGDHYSAKTGYIQGGIIYNLIGGPLAASTREGYNDTYIYITGGETNMVTGGAGTTATYGNRIIQITGGTINYSVFGGSNGADGGNGTGTLKGTGYVYVGGSAVIGNADNVNNNATLYGAEAGSVFGIGNGNTSYQTIGSSDNSIVIINDEATIRRNVYGGGNYGATGLSSSSNSNTSSLLIHGGTIKGSLFGGGNNNGAGSSTKTSTININMTGGIVEGSIYGGANQKGTIYGSININMTGGIVRNSVYGGGLGGYSSSNNPGTFVRDNVSVVIGSTNLSTTPVIQTNVYGGSAYGTVNGNSQTTTLSSSTTSVTINKGTIEGAVFGGGQGSSDSSSIPYVEGNITVTVNGGTIDEVYGGNDAKGTPNGSASVYLKGGNVTIATYGGGRQTGLVTSNVFLQGGNSPLIFGGSNQSGTVTTSNVTTTSGRATTIYGGNNVAGETVTSNVTIGGATITDVYGGGKEATTGTTNVTLNSSSLHEVYGGGEEAHVTARSNVTLAGSTVGTIYGGSNVEGDVANSYVTLNSGTVGTVYGGNNAGGVTSATHVTESGSSVTTAIYGGGNATLTGSSLVNVTVSGNIIPAIYGGGNNDGVTSSVITLNGGNATLVFGGSNQSGTVTTSSVTINDGTYPMIYGGNNAGGTTVTSNVIVNNGTLTDIYGGGKLASTTTTNVTLNGSSLHDVYGGGEEAHVTTRSNVTLTGSTVDTIYGGSNITGTVAESIVNLNSGTVGTVYGGNNAGGSTTITHVNSNGATINISMYGGGEEAPTETSNVIITTTGNSIPNVYGGGNQEGVTTSNVTLTGGTVSSIFGGSNQSGVVATSNVILNGGTVTDVHGGNDNGGTTTNANVTLGGSTVATAVYGGGERADTTNTYVTINSTGNTVPAIYGGGNQASVTNTRVYLNNGTATSVYGGSNQTGTVTNSLIEGTNGTFTTIYGGNNAGGTTVTSNIDITGGTIATIYGGGNEAITNETNVEVTGGTITTVYGGGNEANVVTSNVEITGATVSSTVYGGGNAASVGTTNVTLNNSTIGIDVFGGGNFGTVTNLANLDLIDSTVTGSVYGGGNQASVQATSISITTSNIGANAFGGGNAGTVLGNTQMHVNSSTFTASIYGGGNGATAIVYGNSLLNIDGTTNVTNHVFGGGNAAATGTDEDNISTTTVNIAGATIGGNVYGGANTSVVYGTVYVNIGSNVVTTNNLVAGNINITGTVFGGGEANAAGAENYDYSFISVTTGINIKIDGNNHTNFNISGSIFGSGNASSTRGYSYIDIKNYGTETNYKTNVSIQRADVVTINNSAIHLTGATDRTNEYSSVLFTFSRIGRLKLKNNSTLYLKTGTNLLENFDSLVDVDNEEVKATAVINPTTHEMTRNVLNSIYMHEGKNLNIATNENVTSYGEISGMSFFGMYVYDRDNNIVTAMFDNDYEYGDNVTSNDLYYFSSGSYVLGSHKTNHNYNVDGFYSNRENSRNTGTMELYVIEPTPELSNYYMWIIGETVTSYSINLTASKYSTLGTYEMPLINFSEANTIFTVMGFNYNDLSSDISLVNSSSIPRIASSSTIADNTMALAMKSSNTGWITIGTTEFLTSDTTPVRGTLDYRSENSAVVPSLIFYLYHSKNLATSANLGTVTISLIASTPIDDLNYDTERVNITVELSRALYATNDYEGAMTPGKQYEMFASTDTVITSSSSLSAYYSLFANSNTSIYRAGYHRVLTSSFVLPENTKITMIDFAAANNPKYYYYVVSATDVTTATAEFNSNSEASYPISRFVKMGSSSNTNNYDDESSNSIYYNSSTDIAEEEFIFIVDFSESDIGTDMIDNSLLLELRDSNNQTLISVLGIQHADLEYDLYYNRDSIIEVEGTLNISNLYLGTDLNLTVNTNFIQSTVNNVAIYDTRYMDNKLGIKITIYDENDNVVNGLDLLGVTFTYDNITYYPREDGSVRIKIAEKVANVSSRIVINTTNSTLSSGNYTIQIESFGSDDGIYFGITSSDTTTVSLNVLNTIYGLNATTDEENVIIDHELGYSDNDSNIVAYTINYSSLLTNPNIRVSLYRRDYSAIYTTVYQLVDIKDYILNDLSNTNILKEYLLLNNPQTSNNYIFRLKDNLMTGTYKLKFSLYDGNSYIGSIDKSIVIK